MEEGVLTESGVIETRAMEVLGKSKKLGKHPHSVLVEK
jgi:hypothetical protein